MTDEHYEHIIVTDANPEFLLHLGLCMWAAFSKEDRLERMRETLDIFFAHETCHETGGLTEDHTERVKDRVERASLAALDAYYAP